MALPQRHPALSPREIEVLRWVAEGKRNAEIGCLLEISGRTAEKHLEHIFLKLGVETRSAAGAWWHRQKLAALREQTK